MTDGRKAKDRIRNLYALCSADDDFFKEAILFSTDIYKTKKAAEKEMERKLHDPEYEYNVFRIVTIFAKVSDLKRIAGE